MKNSAIRRKHQQNSEIHKTISQCYVFISQFQLHFSQKRNAPNPMDMMKGAASAGADMMGQAAQQGAGMAGGMGPHGPPPPPHKP